MKAMQPFFLVLLLTGACVHANQGNDLAKSLTTVLHSVAMHDKEHREKLSDYISKNFVEDRNLEEGSFFGCGTFDKYTCIKQKRIEGVSQKTLIYDGAPLSAACLMINGKNVLGDPMYVAYIFLFEDARWKFVTLAWEPFAKKQQAVDKFCWSQFEP